MITLLVYSPARHYAFLDYDDPRYVTQNPMVQGGLTWAGVRWAFTTFHAANWHPLTWLSLMLDCQLFGLDAGWSHLANVFFHAANAALLFVLLWRLTGALWPSTFIAAIFAWHPLRVESVAWISERKDVLSAFFGLLTLLAYVHYAQTRAQATCREKSSKGIAISYALALTLFVFGLMAKPMLVTLPFVFLVLDYWPLQRVPGFELRNSLWLRLFWEKVPFFVLAVASCVVTCVAQNAGEAVVPLEAYPLSSRIENAAMAYVKYLFDAVYPVNLAIIYPLSKQIPWVQVVAAVVGLLMVSWLVWRVRISTPYLFIGWLWYLGMLVPMIGLVQVGAHPVADRYTYLPLIGISIGVVFGLGDLAKRLRVKSIFLAFVSVAMLGGCLYGTARQLQYWRNSETLFEHSIAVTGDNFLALNSLGVGLLENHHFDGAIDCFQRALAFLPAYPITEINLNNALLHEGKFEQAITNYQAAIKLKPNNAAFLNNLAWILATCPEARLRDGQEAVKLAEQACQLTDDRQPQLIGTLAAAYAEAGLFEEAVATAEKARNLALALGQKSLVEKNEELLQLYQARQPYREKAVQSP